MVNTTNAGQSDNLGRGCRRGLDFARFRGFGFDDDESPGPARPDAAKENPEEPVATPESRPASALLHDSELLTQGGIFDSEIKS
jgi:hypothetical protein